MFSEEMCETPQQVAKLGHRSGSPMASGAPVWPPQAQSIPNAPLQLLQAAALLLMKWSQSEITRELSSWA